MKSILIAGGTGLVGSQLKSRLKGRYNIFTLSRKRHTSESDQLIHWDPINGQVADFNSDIDIVINLAGAGVADKRWTSARKKLIKQSRVNSTRVLIDTLRKRKVNIDLYLSASAVGYYGNSGEILMTEEDHAFNPDFLSDVCKAWEDEALKASDIASRVNIIRIGTVLSTKGGALPKMSDPVKYGMASYFGNGQQIMSWIHIDDLCASIEYLLETNTSHNIYNCVAPNPCTNREMIKAIKENVNRFAIEAPVPTLALRLMLGEMADILLVSNNVSADRLQSEGFEFRYPKIEDALQSLFSS